jgi:hypothetical protein
LTGGVAHDFNNFLQFYWKSGTSWLPRQRISGYRA